MTQEEFHKRYQYNPTTDCLGEGGFGKVYKAYDTHRDRWVAIKMAEVKSGLEQVRLKHEVELINKIPTHPNIAYYEECYTFSTFAGEYDFGVLQYYEQGNLEQLVREKQLTSQQKDHILRQILEGIAFLHCQGIIHRDLKPQNILIVNRNGEYISKITDFGISKKLDVNKSSVFTNSLAGAGTLSFASPEQLLGKTIRKNTDLWSFGVITCWIFTGKLPFNSGSQAITSEAGRIELFRQITTGNASVIIKQLPSIWSELVKQCIVVDNEKRIGNAINCLNILYGRINQLVNKTTVKDDNISSIIAGISTVLIPAGTFTMGSPLTEVGRSNNETQHQVTLSTFRMSKYAITNAQYAVFLNAKSIGSNGLYAAGAYPTQELIYASSGSNDWGLHYSGTQWVPVAGYENNPVIVVTWYGATEFATYVGGTLPTEAQWEYACRGGTTTPFNTGNYLTKQQANYSLAKPYNNGTNTVTTYQGKTMQVGSYTPNAYGLYDMHGNVREWCVDWLCTYPTTDQTNPTGAATGSYRVIRGGNWHDGAQYCRSAYRDYNTPSNYSTYFGFRVVFNNELTKTAIYSDYVTDIDGNVYKTVQIGNQVWMAENLKVSRYRNGDLIPNIKDDDEWLYLETGACCNHDNNPGNDAKYGKLYNWYAVDDKRGLAPEGWHVPTYKEWSKLKNYVTENLGYSGFVAKALATTTDWKCYEGYDKICVIGNNLSLNNSSGFGALPGGSRNIDDGIDTFSSIGYGGDWWSAMEFNRGTTFSYVLRISLGNGNDMVNLECMKTDGFSVRCVKD